MSKPWVFNTSRKGFIFCREILIEIISRFPVTQLDAIYIINEHWRNTELVNEHDIAYHETPEFWAKHFYWGNDTLWWKKDYERLSMGLKNLKPLKENYYEEYQLWEKVVSGEEEDYIFVRKSEILELFNRGFIDEEYLMKWSCFSNNYNEALKEFYNYKGWNEYREMY